MRLALAAFVGGVLGTGLRLIVDLALPVLSPAQASGSGSEVPGSVSPFGPDPFASDPFGSLPLGTLLVNVIGSLALGWLVGGLWTRPGVPQWLKVALGPGVLGAFTTFSTVMVAVVGHAGAGVWGLAGLYLLFTIVLGFAGAALGLWTGSRLAHRPIPAEIPDAGLTL